MKRYWEWLQLTKQITAKVAKKNPQRFCVKYQMILVFFEDNGSMMTLRKKEAASYSFNGDVAASFKLDKKNDTVYLRSIFFVILFFRRLYVSLFRGDQ